MRAGGAVARAAGWAFASHSRHLCDQVGTHHSNPSEPANRAMSCTTTPTFHRPLLPTPPPIPPTDTSISSSTPSRSPPRPEGRLERLLMSKSSYLSSCALSAKVNFGSRARSSYVMRAVLREFASPSPRPRPRPRPRPFLSIFTTMILMNPTPHLLKALRLRRAYHSRSILLETSKKPVLPNNEKTLSPQRSAPAQNP